MKITFLFAAIFALILAIPHAGNVAFFNIHLDKMPAELVLEIEANYLGWILNNSKQGGGGELAVKEYLNKHIEIYLNDELCLLNVCEIEPDNFGHIFIKSQLYSNNNFDIKTLKIENTCFLKEVEEQVNVIMIYQKGKEMRGFKMNKERKMIEAAL